MSAVKFVNGVKFKYDRIRKEYVILAPEQVLTLSETSIAVLKLVDGSRTESDICNLLTKTFDASYEVISYDVSEFFKIIRLQGIIV
jgi:pyrroloquinoline quinone biosynthesis protein D